ncbi:alcohol dehydrogenase-like regulatory protein ErcA [Gracilinema caldarium]|uniref:Alcohol dehydrogenase n=1 Tax=Gracilinema caldarium (strain ATCC 51460 / DSM 7334 / H1) TaxID=744872 RepID=F8EY86_GRAC1|nr:alcohol dehydrogenase-like regulatory protein ErcA [Gracilinema caldarium]AEJ18245.1 Alcohol dehydrogenase [Gracilinema caldarium DSM 7334]
MKVDVTRLRKFVAPEFILGAGALARCADYITLLGATKVFIVTDPGLVQAGWVSKVEALLVQNQITFERFEQVSPNPRDYEVMQGAHMYREKRCDLIIAIGGGSPIDCAKGIGIVVSNGGSILDYEGVDKINVPIPPLICIPTTAGTGADISQFAIILDTTRNVKIAIISKSIVPDVSLIDPLCTTTMNANLTATTGMDALTHAFEAYVSNASSPMTDVLALSAIEYIAEHLVEAYHNPIDMDARTGMMVGSLFAGLAFSNASLGIVHAMAHALGGLLDLPHGLCNALILEHSISYNFSAASERYRKIAEIILKTPCTEQSDVWIEQELRQFLHNLRHSLSLGDTIERILVDDTIIFQLSNLALQDPCIVTNPRRPTIDDIEAIYARLF